ncbi:MAG: PAS domain S-box protein, partial [Candidatus Thermoplasmatota archaeon]|nr:PAS domain S-box protein [Candidatus Thermoplasmatota archaeon]
MTSENDLISRFADSIMANLPVGVLTVNTELIIGSVNPFAERLFGTEMGVGIGDDLATLAAELFSTEDRNKLLLGIKGTMEGRVIEPFELCFSRSEFGRSVSILLSPLVESGNPVMGAEITMEDITERKNAENALRASEKKYRSIVEQSEDGIIMMDNEGIVIEWNRGQELLTGISGDEALGLPIWDIDFRLCPDHEKNNPNSYDKIKGRALESLKGEDGPLPNRSLEREFHREDGRSIFVQM